MIVVVIYDLFEHMVVSAQTWNSTQTDNKLILVASPTKEMGAALSYTKIDGIITSLKFKNKSVVTTYGSKICYNTDDVLE